MQSQPENNKVIKNRRKTPRWTVYNFLRATAVLCKSTDINQLRQEDKGQTWVGMLVDISERGAQMLMPNDCEKEFAVDQQAGVCVRTSVEDTDFEVVAKIKSIELLEGKKAVRVNVQFVGVEGNLKARVRLRELFEYIVRLQAVEVV